MKASAGQDAKTSGSVERFGFSWDRFNLLTAEQELQFRGWTPFLHHKTDWIGKTFLDAGCGAGRNSYWPMTYGAAGGLAVDLDDRSLAAATRNLAKYPMVEVRKQSIYEIAEADAFDICFSIGVVHHLDDPDRALANITRATKPGGKILIWVYGRENMGWYIHIMDPLRRAFFSKLPLPIVRALAVVPTALVWMLLRCGYSPNDYWRMITTFSFWHIHHILFDQMLPKIANYWRRDEAEALLRKAGLADIESRWVNQMSWAVIGTKPHRLPQTQTI